MWWRFRILKYFLIHPSIFICLSKVKLQGQQLKQGTKDFATVIQPPAHWNCNLSPQNPVHEYHKKRILTWSNEIIDSWITADNLYKHSILFCFTFWLVNCFILVFPLTSVVLDKQLQCCCAEEHQRCFAAYMKLHLTFNLFFIFFYFLFYFDELLTSYFIRRNALTQRI